jgi:hypothetical protein
MITALQIIAANIRSGAPEVVLLATPSSGSRPFTQLIHLQ